ncbi:MAG: OsmC family protein [Chloroflexi bacterium]|nr:OsmC family protein [Chloroflexota bacterium]
MTERFVTTQARTYSSGTPGRAICNTRNHHFVVDNAPYAGGPAEAITAAEAFLSGVTACAVLMLERVARESNIPLRWADVGIEATRDSEAIHEVHSVYDKVHMVFQLTGPSKAQAAELVEIYKRR